MKKSTERTENGLHKNHLSIGCAGYRRERWERLNGGGEMRKGPLKSSPYPRKAMKFA